MSVRNLRNSHAGAILSLVVGLVFSAGCGADKPSIYSVLRNFEQRNYPKVVEECNALLAENPGDVQAYRFLIRASKQLGTLESLLQASPPDAGEASPEAVRHFAQGYGLVQLKEWERALVELELALEMDPELEYANYVIGWIHFNPLTPFYDEAKGLDAWQRESGMNASSLGALQVYRDLGGYYRNLGRFEEAREQLRAFRDHAFSEGDRIAARDLLEQLKQRELEIVQLQQRADAEAADASELKEYATYLYRWQRQDEAIPYWQRAAALEPDDADLHNYVGMAHMELQQNELAGASFNRALELRADFAEPHHNLGMLYDTDGESRNALFHFERYLEIQQFSEQAEVLRIRVEELRREVGTSSAPDEVERAEADAPADVEATG